MDRGAWWDTAHGVTKSWTRVSDEHTHLTMSQAECWVLATQWFVKQTLLPSGAFPLRVTVDMKQIIMKRI